jgi:hypothetical protein
MPAVPRATADLGPRSAILLAARPEGGRILILRVELRSATMTVRTGRLESEFQMAAAVFYVSRNFETQAGQRHPSARLARG